MAKQGTATAVFRSFIDREVSLALRQLRIPSLAAFQRERRTFGSRYTADGGYEDAPPRVKARVEALEMIHAITFDGPAVPLEFVDEWAGNLRKCLPRALKRPLTPPERKELFAKIDAARAEQEMIRREKFARRAA